MGLYLSARELAQLESAENAFPSPVPTQIISNGEFNPLPQTVQQNRAEARIKELADQHGAKQGLDRRQFLRTSCGMQVDPSHSPSIGRGESRRPISPFGGRSWGDSFAASNILLTCRWMLVQWFSANT
jgi:hypothetical protein